MGVWIVWSRHHPVNDGESSTREQRVVKADIVNVLDGSDARRDRGCRVTRHRP